MLRELVLIILGFALVTVFTACDGSGQAAGRESLPTLQSGTPTSSPAALGKPFDLAGSEWVLASMNEADPAEGATVTLDFPRGDYLQGYAGCNHYGADYSRSGNGFTIDGGRIDRTAFDCDDPENVMQQEYAFFDALAKVARYGVVGELLVFEDAAGETILAFEKKPVATIDPALADSKWVLFSLHGSDLIAGSHINLGFADGRAGGFAGCNSYGAEYTAADDGVLTVPEIASAAMDCPTPDGVVKQEQAFIAALGNAAAYRLTTEWLSIEDASGESTLMFFRKDRYPMDPSELVGTNWQLLALDGAAPIDGATYTLGFDTANEITGHAGCRGYRATYEASSEGIGLAMLEMIGSHASCSDALMQQEGEFTTSLGWTSTYLLREGQLEIHSSRGEVLLFEAVPREVVSDQEATPTERSPLVGGGTATPTPLTWPGPTSTPQSTGITPAVYPSTTRTGVAEVDRVIDALLAKEKGVTDEVPPAPLEGLVVVFRVPSDSTGSDLAPEAFGVVFALKGLPTLWTVYVLDGAVLSADSSDAPPGEIVAAAGGEIWLPPKNTAQISDSQASYTWSQASPDGKWLAEGSMRTGIRFKDREYYHAQLKATSADGAAAHILFEIVSPFGLGYTIPDPVGWSNDGRDLYFTIRPVADGCGLFVNGGDLYRADLADGSIELLFANGARALAASPDGQRVAYVPWGLPPALVIHDLDTGQDQRIELDGDVAGAIQWSPDGTRLAVTVAKNACLPDWTHAIVQVDSSTGAQTALVRFDERRFITQEWTKDNSLRLSDSEDVSWWLDVDTGELSAED